MASRRWRIFVVPTFNCIWISFQPKLIYISGERATLYVLLATSSRSTGRMSTKFICRPKKRHKYQQVCFSEPKWNVSIEHFNITKQRHWKPRWRLFYYLLTFCSSYVYNVKILFEIRNYFPFDVDWGFSFTRMHLNSELCVLREGEEVILQNFDQHNFYARQTIIIIIIYFPRKIPLFCNVPSSASRFQVHRIQNILIYAFIHLKVTCGLYDAIFRFWLKINVYFFIT